MKDKTYLANSLLALVTGIVCLVLVLVKTFSPATILPLVDIPNTVAVIAGVLVIDSYILHGEAVKRNYIAVALLAVATFWLIPWASGVVDGFGAALRYGVIAGALFTLICYLFDAINERISSAKAGKFAILAPLSVGAGMYLAFQSFVGILL